MQGVVKMLERKHVTSEEEIEALHEVVVKIWQEVFTPIIGEQQVAYMLENYQGKENIRQEIEQGTCYYSLYYQEELVGYTAYEVKKDHLYLSKIYISESYRGKGLMREVFDWYDQLSKNLALKQYLRVNQGNKQAIDVYQKRGFKLMREDIADIGEGYQMVDYIFEKNS